MDLPVWTFDASGAIAPGDPELNAEPGWCYAGGNDRLAELLAEGLDVRRGVRVAALRRTTHDTRQRRSWRSRVGVPEGYDERRMTSGVDARSLVDGRWSMVDVTGHHVADADAVLLTAPAPQSAAILAASDMDAVLKERLLAELGRAAYRRCISLALAYDAPLERPYYALLNADRAHPIAWLALEHAKGVERCPPGHSLLVAQMAPRWSLERWEAPTDEIAPEVAQLASELLGADLRHPLWWDRRGWREALPDAGCDFDTLNGAGGGLFFAGDATAGQGRAHLAIASGWRAAERIGAVAWRG
jgi:predicted NAD/FAD-dependent oxidoreductase